MTFHWCEFETDVTGIYITPLVGYSNVRGQKSIWFGWLFWLFTIKLNKPETESFTSDSATFQVENVKYQGDY